MFRINGRRAAPIDVERAIISSTTAPRIERMCDNSGTTVYCKSADIDLDIYVSNSARVSPGNDGWLYYSLDVSRWVDRVRATGAAQ